MAVTHDSRDTAKDYTTTRWARGAHRVLILPIIIRVISACWRTARRNCNSCWISGRPIATRVPFGWYRLDSRDTSKRRWTRGKWMSGSWGCRGRRNTSRTRSTTTTRCCCSNDRDQHDDYDNLLLKNLYLYLYIHMHVYICNAKRHSDNNNRFPSYNTQIPNIW